MGRSGVWAVALVAACSAGDGVGDTDNAALGDSSAGPAGETANPSGASEDGDAGSESSQSATSANDTSGAASSGESTDGIPEGCQNDYVDPGEECDDGNDVNADGCNRDCRESGQLLWSVTHGAGVGMVDEGFAVVIGSSGSTVSGYVSDAAELRDGWITRFDATGSVVWSGGNAGVGGENDEIRGLVEDAAGNVYASGYESGPTGEGLNAWLRKYDSAGAEVWTRTYNGPNNSTDVFDAVTIDGDGNLVAAGYHNVDVEGTDVFLRKYDPDGNVLWTRSSSGPNGGTDLIWKVEPSPAGFLYVAGYENGPAGEGSNAWLAKYDADGNAIWTRSYNGAASLDDYLIGVAVIGDDDVVVCGYEASVDYPWNITVRRYDSLGMLVWADDFAGATGEGAHCFGIAIDGDGNIATTGGEIVATIRGVMVRKYDPDGTVLWSTVIPGGAMGPDYGRELAVGDHDELFITGAVDTGADARDIWLGVLTP